MVQVCAFYIYHGQQLGLFLFLFSFFLPLFLFFIFFFSFLIFHGNLFKH